MTWICRERSTNCMAGIHGHILSATRGIGDIFMEVVTFELDLRGTTLLQERSSLLKISKVLTVGLIHILCPTHGMLLLFFNGLF